jgi:hypothetical protein
MHANLKRGGKGEARGSPFCPEIPLLRNPRFMPRKPPENGENGAFSKYRQTSNFSKIHIHSSIFPIFFDRMNRFSGDFSKKSSFSVKY